MEQYVVREKPGGWEGENAGCEGLVKAEKIPSTKKFVIWCLIFGI